MTLEFEKLTHELEKMAATAARRQQYQQQHATALHETLEQFATDWAAIDTAVQLAQANADEKYYRAARPFADREALNAAIDPPPCPAEAIIIATDGSQIMPDRHAAFLYYLVNIGAIVYHHGNGASPLIVSEPQLRYADPADEDEVDVESDWQPRALEVTLERDLAEIGYLARMTWEHRVRPTLVGATPVLAMLDQRLLYWPFGGSEEMSLKIVRQWMKEMTAIRKSGGWLAGYIDRPGKTTVVTLLQSLTAGEGFDWKSLGKRSNAGPLRDADLFSTILQPGQRSAVFVELSPTNKRFAEEEPFNEVCFFFINPGQVGRQIARVDIPRWVAEDQEAVAAIHALIYSQCQIVGAYPYVLARAHELAVVGRQDAADLNMMIDIYMQRAGINSQNTHKQNTKDLFGGRSRHMGL